MAIKEFLKKLVPKVGKEEPAPEEQEVPKKSGDICAFCQGENPDKKWMGQMWHKECLRKAKKMAKKMI